MSSRSPISLWSLALSAALLAAGCASTTPSPPAADPPTDAGAAAEAPDGEAAATAPAEVETEAAAEPSAGAPSPQEPSAWIEPPDGEWLVDEGGRRYFLMEVPKVEGAYRWEDDGKVRLPRGMRYDVAEEGDDHFMVKVYYAERRTPVNEPPPYSAPPPVAPIEVSTPPASDRLSFVPFDQGLPRRGQWRNGFEVVDFDGDGHPDIVHAPPRKGTPVPRIFLGDGAGAWTSFGVRDLPRGLRLDYGDVAVADFDRDGRLDLALGVHIRGVVVLLHDGEGAFRSWSEGLPYAQPDRGEGTGAFSTRTIVAHDWNGDGWMDLIALGEGLTMVRPDRRGFIPSSSDLAVFLNRGDGTWEQEGLGGDRRLRGEDLALGDLDGDGREDIAVGTMSTASADILFLAGEGGDAEVARLPDVPRGAVLPAVATADFDGDGRQDLAVSHLHLAEDGWRSGVFLYMARADGWERRTLLELPGRVHIGSMTTGRLPGDEHLDLVSVDGTGEVRVLLGDGRGGFHLEAGPAMEESLAGCQGYHLALADLDGVEGDELVVGFAGEPGGEMIFGEAPSCASNGGLRAWKAVDRATAGAGR